jgi:hypothetical protein
VSKRLNGTFGVSTACHPEPPESRGRACGCEGRRTTKDPELRAGGAPFARTSGSFAALRRLPRNSHCSCGFDAPVGATDGSRWWSGTRRHRLPRRIKARPGKGAGRSSRTTDRRPLQRPCRGAYSLPTRFRWRRCASTTGYHPSRLPARSRAQDTHTGSTGARLIQKPPLFQLDANLCGVSSHSVAAPRSSFLLDDTRRRTSPVWMTREGRTTPAWG